MRTAAIERTPSRGGEDVRAYATYTGVPTWVWANWLLRAGVWLCARWLSLRRPLD